MKKALLKGRRFAGSNLFDGWTYHDLPWGFQYNSHRKNTDLRVAQIIEHLPVEGMHGLDLGCSVGGLTFRLQMAGANMMGIDYDSQSIELAQGLERAHRTGAVFRCAEISPDLVEELPHFDFALFLDGWMWVAQKIGVGPARGVLSQLERRVGVLFFSTSQNNSMAKDDIQTEADVRNLLETCTDYEVEAIGTVADCWHKRMMFKCLRS